MRERGALRDEKEPFAPAPTDNRPGGEEPGTEAGEDSDDDNSESL